MPGSEFGEQTIDMRSEEQAGARPRLLVAEDNVVNQRVAAAMLNKIGYLADVVANGAAAVEALSRLRYEAVLMDCQMPEMDGYAATAEIRRREQGQEHVPIIAMTAGAMKGDRERCLAAGMDDYVVKPVMLDDLAAVLKRWIDPHSEASEGAAGQSARAGDGPLDLALIAELRELADDAPGGFKAMLGTFFREAARRIAELERAVAAADADAVGRVAHSLRGSSAMFGAQVLAAICAEVDRAAGQGDVRLAAPLVARVPAAFAEAQEALTHQFIPLDAPRNTKTQSETDPR